MSEKLVEVFDFASALRFYWSLKTSCRPCALCARELSVWTPRRINTDAGSHFFQALILMPYVWPHDT